MKIMMEYGFLTKKRQNVEKKRKNYSLYIEEKN